MDKELSLSARMVGVRRALLVSCFIRRWGWSNAANIALCAGVNRLRYADELVKRGFLIRLATDLPHNDRYAYILSTHGLQCALDELDRFGDSIPGLPPYTYMEHRRVGFLVHAHNMVMQEILLRLALDVGIYYHSLWSSEWEERSRQDEAVCPDATDTFSYSYDSPPGYQPLTRFHEVELSQKSGARLNHWLSLRISHLLESGKGNGFFCVWSASDAIIDSYNAALEKPIASFLRTQTGALIVDQSKPWMQAEPWMFRFFRLRRDIQTGAWHPEDKDIEMLRAETNALPRDLE
jgi:hypothetical protein